MEAFDERAAPCRHPAADQTERLVAPLIDGLRYGSHNESERRLRRTLPICLSALLSAVAGLRERDVAGVD